MPYAEYCANLVTAKHTLEAKKLEPAFQDFLQVSSGPACTCTFVLSWDTNTMSAHYNSRIHDVLVHVYYNNTLILGTVCITELRR